MEIGHESIGESRKKCLSTFGFFFAHAREVCISFFIVFVAKRFRKKIDTYGSRSIALQVPGDDPGVHRRHGDQVQAKCITVFIFNVAIMMTIERVKCDWKKTVQQVEGVSE